MRSWISHTFDVRRSYQWCGQNHHILGLGTWVSKISGQTLSTSVDNNSTNISTVNTNINETFIYKHMKMLMLVIKQRSACKHVDVTFSSRSRSKWDKKLQQTEKAVKTYFNSVAKRYRGNSAITHTWVQVHVLPWGSGDSYQQEGTQTDWDTERGKKTRKKTRKERKDPEYPHISTRNKQKRGKKRLLLCFPYTECWFES